MVPGAFRSSNFYTLFPCYDYLANLQDNIGSDADRRIPPMLSRNTDREYLGNPKHRLALVFERTEGMHGPRNQCNSETHTV